MFKIQTLNVISSTGLNQFPKEYYEVGPEVTNPDAILVRSHDLHGVPIPKGLMVIGRAGAGLNNIPVEAYTKRGIPVLNTPGANANAVRELVIAGMLLASRNIYQAWQYLTNLKTDGVELGSEIEKHKKQFVGFEVMGKTLGVVGLGSVGVKVANAAAGLGMQVIGYDPSLSVSHAWELSSSVQQASHLDALLAASDYVSLHVPLMQATKGMINAAALTNMREGAVLLNFAREEIVDHRAIADALDSHKIYAYVSDFPSLTLKDHPRVIHLPHLGASTKEAEENCAVMIVKGVRDYLEHGIVTHSANFPLVEIPYNGAGTRLTIVNQNIPNMVAQISGILAREKINIAGMLNKSRDEIAYNIIDIAGEVNKSTIDAINKIQGVIQVRQLERPIV